MQPDGYPHHEAGMNKEKTEARKKEGFEEFLLEPLVRLALSNIPPGEHQDTLRMLLQASFNKGFSCGQCDMGMDITDSLLKQAKKKGYREDDI